MRKLIQMMNLETGDWTSLVNECLELIMVKEGSNHSVAYEFVVNESKMKKYGLRKTKAGSFSFMKPIDFDDQ